VLCPQCLHDPLEISRVDASEARTVSHVDDRSADHRTGRLRVAEEFDGTIENLDQIGGAQRRSCVEGVDRCLQGGGVGCHETIGQRHARHIGSRGQIAVRGPRSLEYSLQCLLATAAKFTHLAG
jgi:hypothetical protein